MLVSNAYVSGIGPMAWNMHGQGFREFKRTLQGLGIPPLPWGESCPPRNCLGCMDCFLAPYFGKMGSSMTDGPSGPSKPSHFVSHVIKQPVRAQEESSMSRWGVMGKRL
jgi:hypothetical protein